MNTCYIARKHHPSRGEVVEGPASFPHPMGQLLSLRRHPLPDFCCTGASSSIPCVHSTLTSYNAATSRGRHPQQPEWLPLTINPIHLVLCANAQGRLPSSHCHPPNVACPCLLRQRVLTLGTDFSLPFQGVLFTCCRCTGCRCVYATSMDVFFLHGSGADCPPSSGNVGFTHTPHASTEGTHFDYRRRCRLSIAANVDYHEPSSSSAYLKAYNSCDGAATSVRILGFFQAAILVEVIRKIVLFYFVFYLTR